MRFVITGGTGLIGRALGADLAGRYGRFYPPGLEREGRASVAMVVQILKTIAAIGTIATGLISLIRPESATGFIGLEPTGGRGITEIRAVLGGFFIALGVSPLIFGTPDTYRMLGIAYLVVAVVRAGSMIIDESVVQSNIISLVVEIIFGVILVL